MNNTMSSYFSNLYLFSAILVSMIIHLILLIVTDLTLNQQYYLSPSSDIEISFITPIPIPNNDNDNDNLRKKLASKSKDSTKVQKVIVPTIQKKIKNNTASVKTAPTIKKITPIDSNQILSNIKELIPIRIPNNNKKFRSKKISSSTVDYEYRLYFEAWRQKVERIGALNYPEAAKSGIFGALRLTVSLTQAGNIENIVINKSSGYSELDKAAISIVRMGAPYAKFSNRMRNEVDIIRITRTWKFTEGNKFSSQ
jgi:protein TonB